MKGMGIPKHSKVKEVEVSAYDLDAAVELIKKATAGTKPMKFEICASYEEGE